MWLVEKAKRFSGCPFKPDKVTERNRSQLDPRRSFRTQRRCTRADWSSPQSHMARDPDR